MKQLNLEKLMDLCEEFRGLQSRKNSTFILLLKYQEKYLLCCQMKDRQIIKGVGTIFRSVTAVKNVFVFKREKSQYIVAVVLEIVVSGEKKLISLISGMKNCDTGVTYFAIADENENRVSTFSVVETADENYYSKAFCYKQDLTEVIECQHRIMLALLGINYENMPLLLECNNNEQRGDICDF